MLGSFGELLIFPENVIWSESISQYMHLPLPNACSVMLLLITIGRMEYFDDLAVEQPSSPEEAGRKSNVVEPAAVCHKNLKMMGVTLYADEFNRATRTPSSKASTLDSQVLFYNLNRSDRKPALSQGNQTKYVLCVLFLPWQRHFVRKLNLNYVCKDVSCTQRNWKAFWHGCMYIVIFCFLFCFQPV